MENEATGWACRPHARGRAVAAFQNTSVRAVYIADTMNAKCRTSMEDAHVFADGSARPLAWAASQLARAADAPPPPPAPGSALCYQQPLMRFLLGRVAGTMTCPSRHSSQYTMGTEVATLAPRTPP